MSEQMPSEQLRSVPEQGDLRERRRMQRLGVATVLELDFAFIAISTAIACRVVFATLKSFDSIYRLTKFGTERRNQSAGCLGRKATTGAVQTGRAVTVQRLA
jgi:hypothetical protein